MRTRDNRAFNFVTGSALIAAVVLVAAACGGNMAQSNAADDAATGDTAGDTAITASLKLRRIVSNAKFPVALSFDRSGHLVYAEKDDGRIIRIVKGKKHVIARLHVASGGETGLLGLTFDSAGHLFASFTSDDSNCPSPFSHNSSSDLQGHCVWRLKRNSAGRYVADKRIFAADHPSTASNHVGGGVHIGPDGALYYMLGDLGENDDPDKGPNRAQSLSVPYGKMLRLDPDGFNKPAAGNPTTCGNVANTSQRTISFDPIFACGLRNTYEFAFGPDGRLWGSEAGDGCDEINVIKSGVNYGWEPPRTDCAGEGAGKPFKKVSGTPAGIDVWSGKSAGGWRNQVFYCANSGEGKLMRLNPKTRGLRAVGVANDKCYLDVTTGKNGLYFSSYDKIYRLSR